MIGIECVVFMEIASSYCRCPAYVGVVVDPVRVYFRGQTIEHCVRYASSSSDRPKQQEFTCIRCIESNGDATVGEFATAHLEFMSGVIKGYSVPLRGVQSSWTELIFCTRLQADPKQACVTR